MSIKADAVDKSWTDVIAALQMHGQHTGFKVNSTPPTKFPVEVEFLFLLYQMENASINDEASQIVSSIIKGKWQ